MLRLSEGLQELVLRQVQGRTTADCSRQSQSQERRSVQQDVPNCPLAEIVQSTTRFQPGLLTRDKRRTVPISEQVSSPQDFPARGPKPVLQRSQSRSDLFFVSSRRRGRH